MPNRSRCRIPMLFALAGVLLALAAPAQAKPGDTKSFVILHTNDQHGHLLPFSYPDRVSPDDQAAQMPVRKNIGGIARRATLVRQIRSREKNVFLFDAGDCMDGTPFSTEFFAQADFDAMNGVGYDFGVPGNHDFNMTAAQFDDLVRLVKFPWLLANVRFKAKNATPLPPYKIANWDGLRVAVFGLVVQSTQNYKAAQEAFIVLDPMSVARELVPRLRKLADLVILVSHVGLEVDQRIAREVPGIDVIVGGHSHTRLPLGAYEIASYPAPGDPRGAGTVIVQAHQWVGELGRLDLGVTEGADGRWRVTRYNAGLLPVTEEIAEDPAVARTVASYWDRIKEKYGVVLGQAAGEFTEAQGLDYTNYYLVADAVAEAFGVPFDLENRSGVRGPLLKGPVTVGDLIEMDPFDNTVVTFQIRGADLKRVLLTSRPSTSAALRYEARRDERPPNAARSMAADRRPPWRLVSATLGGKAIEDDALYRGATNSYFFNQAVKPHARNVRDTGRQRRNVLADYIRRNSPLSPRADGRNDFGGTDPFPGNN